MLYSKLEYEAIEILIYDFISSDLINEIIVDYNNIKQLYILKQIKSELINELSLTTLFKDDYNLITIFYNYYIKQGVTNFYLYYNGKLSNDIILKYNLPGVTLIEWNYPYWIKNYFSNHYAQMGQMHHALFKFGKDLNKYMIFCDLDEYLYIPNIKLIDYIKNNDNIDIFGFNNLWCDVEQIDINIPNNINCSDEILKFKDRSKCIYNTEIVNTIGIHYTNNNFTRLPVINNDNIMLHFYKWSGKIREENTKNTMTLNLL